MTRLLINLEDEIKQAAHDAYDQVVDQEIYANDGRVFTDSIEVDLPPGAVLLARYGSNLEPIYSVADDGFTFVFDSEDNEDYDAIRALKLQ